MIELSGYTGKSADSVRNRMIASNDMKTAKHVGSRKKVVKYSTLTMVAGMAFSLLEGGMTKEQKLETEVTCPEEFEKFACELTMKKHKNPQVVKKDGKYTIFSKLSNEHYYVDILDFSRCA